MQEAFLRGTLALARRWDRHAADFDGMDQGRRLAWLAVAGIGSAVASACVARMSLHASGVLPMRGRAPGASGNAASGGATAKGAQGFRRRRKVRPAGSATGCATVIPCSGPIELPAASAVVRGGSDGGDLGPAGAAPDVDLENAQEGGEAIDESSLDATDNATDAKTLPDEPSSTRTSYPPHPPDSLPLYEEDGHLGTYYIAGSVDAPASVLPLRPMEARRQLSPEQCLEDLRRHLTPHLSAAAKKASAESAEQPEYMPGRVSQMATASPSSFGLRPDRNAFSLPDFTDKDSSKSDETTESDGEEGPRDEEVLKSRRKGNVSESSRMRKDLLHRGERSIAIEHHPSQQRTLLRPSSKLNFRTPGFARVRSRASLDGPGWDRSQRQPRAAMSMGKLPPKRSAMNSDVALPSPSRTRSALATRRLCRAAA